MITLNQKKVREDTLRWCKELIKVSNSLQDVNKRVQALYLEFQIIKKEAEENE